MTFKISKTSAVVAVLVCLIAAVGLGVTLYITYSYVQNTRDASPSETTLNKTSGGAVDQTLCGYCGSEINVTLRVECGLEDLKFNHSIEVSGRRRELVFFLQQAAATEEEFRFSADYQKYGLFITAINGVKADYTADRTFWQIANGSYVPLSSGVNSYIPEHKETIIFTLVKSSGH